MKLGLFFGAGAEVSYGLPSGGKFAIELFRQNNSILKTNLRNELSAINERSSYATSWLPKNYNSCRIHAFGKNEFTSLIESSIEYKKNTINKSIKQY